MNSGCQQIVLPIPQAGVLDQTRLLPPDKLYLSWKTNLLCMHEILVGRSKKDLEKFGTKCTGFIGKHIVGKGEEAHLTNKIALDLLRPHMILICGKRGSGKCVEENTLITLDDGSMLPIKNLEYSDQKIYGLNDKLKISPMVKSKFYRREVTKLLCVKFRSGREIKITPEHPLLSVNGWFPVKELDIGSRVATPRKINVFGSKVMNDCEIKLLAYLIAEGHLSSGFILFSNRDPDILNDFEESLNNFDKSLKIEVHSKSGCFRIAKRRRVSDASGVLRDVKGRFTRGSKTFQVKSSLRLWLEKIGIYGKLSREKYIPKEIFQLPKYQLALFLNRLFSCDGSIYKHKVTRGYTWQISYSSSSETLIRQVQHLLLRFEILSKLRKREIQLNDKKFINFELILSSSNVIKFINSIGLFGKKTERQEESLKDSLKIIRNPNVDTIPKDIWNIYRPKNWAQIGRSLGYSIPKGLRTSINYSPSREKLMLIAKNDENWMMYLLATSDIFWDEIVEITELNGKFSVCDISVPRFHNFVANDIIVHNSYTAGVMMEEIVSLPEEFRNNLTTVVIDTMGIYWTTKLGNEQQLVLLNDWGLKTKDLKDRVRTYVPYKQKKEFEEMDVPVDFGISIPPYEFSAEDWALAFNLPMTNPLAISLQKAVNDLKKKEEKFQIDDLISSVKDSRGIDTHTKSALENMLSVAGQWGVFGEEGIKIDEIMKPGMINVFDVSRLRATGAWSVRNLLVALISRKIYNQRILARRQEELARVGEGKVKGKKPMVWLFMDEAHQFIPSGVKTVSTDPLLTIVKQGREPGISFVPMTQMPNKLHQDVVSQCDMVISHRLTSKNDLDALHSVMQTYLMEDIWKYIDSLPKWTGSAIILDDNSERIHTIQVRPRHTWHAGEAAIAVSG